MKCQDIVELLSAYANDELSRTQREFVEEHIADCPDCRAKLEEFKIVRSQLVSLREVPAAADIREATMVKIKETGHFARRWLRPVLAAVPVITIVAVLVTLQPWVASPQSILAKAKAAVAELDSYRIFIVNSDETGETVSRIEIEYVAPDRYHYIRTGSRTELNQEFITIGDEAFFKDAIPSNIYGMSAWSQAGGYSMLISEEYTLQTLDYLKDIKKLPDVTLDGTACLHYTGTFDIEKQLRSMSETNVEMGMPPMSETEFQEMLAKFQERERKTELELWIGKDDYLMRRMKHITSVLDENGEPSLSVTDMIYNFTGVFTIEAPRDPQGNLLPGWVTTVPDYPHFSTDIQVEVDNYDPSNRRVNYSINLTNTSAEKLTDVDIKINEMFPGMNTDIAGKVWFRWEHGQYHDGPYTIDPGKTLKYSCTFGYDATFVEPDRIAEIIENSYNSVSYTQAGGQRKMEIFRFEVPESIYTLSTDVPAHLVPVNLKPAGEYRLEEPGAIYTGRGVSGEIHGKEYLFVEVNTAGAEPPASTGVLVLKIEDRTHPEKVAFIDTGDDTRYIRGAALYGTVLYVSADDYLWVLDVSDPSIPKEMARIPGLGNNLMLISGRYAFINDGNHDIVTFDLSDPANPGKIGSLPLSSRTGIQMALYGDYIFAEANDILYTIDASSPESLEIVSEYSFRGAIDDEKPYIEYPLYMMSWEVQGDYAYINLSNEGMVAIGVLDISEPSDPRDVAFLKLRDRRLEGSLFVMEDTLFMLTRGSMDMLRKTRLEFIDISNPAEPVEKGFGIMPDAWTFFSEPSGGSHQTYNLIDDYLYWFIGDSPNLPVIEIFDLSELNK